MGIYEIGQYVEVHPTFLYESVITFLLFIILLKISKNRKFSGQLTYIYLIIYGIVRTVIEGLRIDSLMIGDIRISQAVSAILAITGIILYSKEKRNILH